jgi:membrane protease YdiL (CAAX protease family)
VISERQPVGLGRAVFASVTLFVLLVFVESLFGVLGAPGARHIGLLPAITSSLITVLCVALLLPVCFELAFANRLRDPAAFGAARARRWVSGIAIFLPVGFVVLVVTGILTSVIGLPGDNNIPTGGSSLGYTLAVAVLAVVVAPWTEEMMIRGFLFSGLYRRFGFWPAAFLSGFVWAGLHLVWGVLIIFTAEGVLLAWLRARTGSVLPGIGLHGSWNTLVSATTGGGWLPLPILGLLMLTLVLAWRQLPGPALRTASWP